jgi:DNA-binding MarR family transcriptional regulator
MIRGMSEISLTSVEERILVALYKSQGHGLLSDEISAEAEISISTLAYEQKRLFTLGLLQKRIRRYISEDRISRRVIYELTDKGEQIAFHLEHISSMLSGKSVARLENPVLAHEQENHF